ncbi:MAG: uracil permease [Clostridia bacterium]|nr:uracil permease [Clostridia bacterium]
MERKVIQVEEKVPLLQGLPLSFQHLFAMFGASVLVPALFGINPAVVLFMNGIGTLLFIFLTKGKAPAFLGSSFAYLGPTFIILANKELGFQAALGGFAVSGLVFSIVALLIGKFGTDWIKVVLPPAAMGPVVALIGLELSGTAAQMAGLIPSDYHKELTPDWIIVSMVTLAVAVFGSLLFRKFFAVIPILVAIIVGYVVAIPLGLVSFENVAKASVFALPNFQLPVFNINAILIILPATLVVISEHIGHQIVTGNIIGRDLTKDPGLNRSMLGDGLSTMISGLLGSVPTTTYGENIGVMAITRVYSVWVIGGAAVLSIILSFVGTLSALVSSIPTAVMGGVSILLFGVIAASGIRILVESKVDFGKSANLILTAVIFVIGISGVAINIGQVQLKGMALATVTGMVLSLVFYVLEKLKLTNDSSAA